MKLLKNIEAIIDQEMENINAVKSQLATLQSLSIWNQSNRSESFADNLFKIEWAISKKNHKFLSLKS